MRGGRGPGLRGRALAAATLALGLVGIGLPAPRASAAPPPSSWLAGAAAVAVTPPLYNPADDARDFPLCDTAHFNGPRLFDFEEPYIDAAHTGQFQYPDPYCDANANGRWDGVYTSGGVARLMTWVQSDIWARALAISDGGSTVVIESVTSQGLGREDVQRIRAAVNGYRGASHNLPAVTQTFVSSNHNESSPDPIGIYGAPADPTGAFGLHSGIDDYYISFLVSQAAAAGKQAVDHLTAARMRVGEVTPPDVRARLSSTFLTTDSNQAVSGGSTANGTPEATNTKALVLQLVDAGSGANIETVLNWAAHNQQTGHAPSSAVAPDPAAGGALKPINQSVSDDWPGIFAAAVTHSIGGQAMFLVGDNGSIEDPHLYPPQAGECPSSDYSPPPAQPQDEGCSTLPRLTGSHLAADVLDMVGASPTLGAMADVAPHALAQATAQFAVPLQNQLFNGAFAAGLFAHHTVSTASPCIDSTGKARICFTTEAGLVDLGPQLELVVNPGEAYPALTLGHPFGMEEMSCPERAEPPIPAWHAAAAHKLEVGLGDDMIGYEIPAPGWFADAAVYADPSCPPGTEAQSNPTADIDQHNNYHKLESESVGPDGGSAVATNLAALADCAAAATLGACSTTPSTCRSGPRTIEPGRFVLADGSFTRRGRDGPVGLWVLPCGSTVFSPGAGTLLALPGVQFGTAGAAQAAQFMDFDGTAQAAPDINTRGMLVANPDGSVSRYFVDPYAPLTGASPGPALPVAQVAETPAAGLLAAVAGVAVVPASVAARRRRAGSGRRSQREVAKG